MKMKQQKILFVANVAKEHILKFHIPTIRKFREQGWIVDVACSGDEEIPFCNNQYYMCWQRSPFTTKTFRGIRDLKKIIDANNYDVVYCHTPVGGLVARLAARNARKKGTKVIYCAHGLHFFKGAPKKNWLIFYPIERFLAAFTDVIFAVNKEDYAILTRRFHTKTLLVPEVGVNFQRLDIENPDEVRKNYRQKLQIDDNTTVLIYVAEIIPNKNQKMLIDATKELLNQGRNVSLLLPGPEHDGGVAQRYASEIGIGDRVKFLGWRNDVGELMRSADICVASSIREGFGINLVEAMYCGLPVVATKNRGHDMIIEDGVNGYLVDTGDSCSMAKKVAALIDDKTKFRGQDVSQYDCENIAAELFGIISHEIGAAQSVEV